MTSTGQLPEPWKSSAATLFNPYLNINQTSNPARQQSVRTHSSTPTQHVRGPTESLVGAGNLKVTSSESQKRPKSKHFPSSNATEEVSIYVQQMIHYQSAIQSETQNDEKLKRTMSTPNSRMIISKRTPINKQQTRVSEYELGDFFNTSNEQMSRITSLMLSHDTSSHENYSQWGESLKHRPYIRPGLTLADMCNLASNIGDKMSQSKEKVGLETIRGFRLPSARLNYEPYEHHPMDVPVVLGQQTVNDPIRLNDVLTDDNFTKEAMIEFVDNSSLDDRVSRGSRRQPKSATSTSSKIVELKDWRGKITQGNLPDVRSQSRRIRSESAESPQRPCTAASNLSKSRPETAEGLTDGSQKEEVEEEEELKIVSTKTGTVRSAPVGSALKNPSSSQQRQRSYPLNVRIHETIVKQDTDRNNNKNETVRARSVQYTENILDPPVLRPRSENNDRELQTKEIVLRPLSETKISTRTTPITMYTRDSLRQDDHSPDSSFNKRNYKLIPSSSTYAYRTIPESNENFNTNQRNEQFTQLSLPQLELLENYDPTISAKIGAAFIPVQMLARPRDAQQSAKRTTEQIERDYPKKNGQPIFEPRSSRSAHSLIDIAQTLQLTKSKRIPVERQTTFERPENEAPVEESIQIKSLENPNRLTIELYTPPKQSASIKHPSPTRRSLKIHPNQSDVLAILDYSKDQQANIHDHKKEEEPMESNLSVINIRTHQEVDQIRPRKRTQQKRLVFPTTIVTNTNITSPRQQKPRQQGRPIPSVFLTQDPDEYKYSTSVYRHAKTDVDIKRAFKGFVTQNLQRKLSADERKKREEQQKAAIKIQRAFREHLQRRTNIDNRRPSSSEARERERDHRKILSAKRAQHVERQLIEQTRIRKENKQYEKMIDDAGPSVEIFGKFNQVQTQFSKATLNRAATCIQRWWKGFIIRHRWNSLKEEVATFGATWSEFLFRYRELIRRIQKMRESEHRQFNFNRDQAKDFLVTEKKLTTIYNTLSFNDELDQNEVEKFFECCDLSATPYEIQEGLKSVIEYNSLKKKDSLTKAMVFDVVYYIYPPLGTGIESTRKSTWVRPIIDGEDESAIQGTPFLEPTDINVVYKLLNKP